MWASNPTAVRECLQQLYSNCQAWKSSGWTFFRRWSDKHTVVCLWVRILLTNNKLWLYASSMVFKHRKLSKGSQIQKATYYMIPCIKHSVKGKTSWSKNRWVIPWNSRCGRGWQLRRQHEGTLLGARTALHLNCNHSRHLSKLTELYLRVSAFFCV